MSPAIDAVLTMCPGTCWAIIRGTNVSMPWITPQRLTPTAHSQSRWVADSSPPQRATPALLHSTWTAPISANARSASAWTCSSRLTSVLTATAALPARATSATVSAIPASSRSATTTRAPSRAKARESARPIPLAPPVTTATLPPKLSIASPRVAWCVLTEPPRVSRRREEMSSVSASWRWYSLGGDVGGPSPTFHPSEPDAMTELDHVDYRLPTTVVPSRYDLRLEPDLDNATFGGEETVTVEVREPVTEIVLNAAELRIESAAMEDASGAVVEGSVTHDEPAERASIRFSASIAPGPWRLRLRFTGILNDRLHGFYRSSYKDAAGAAHTIAATQFEATDARRAFPCWGEPAAKAVFGVTLVVPEGLAAISNTAVVSESPAGPGRRAVTFADSIRMSTYLVAFVVGELEATPPVMVGKTPLRIWCVPGKTHLARVAQQIGAFTLEFFEQYYGLPYPGDKLDLLAIPDFAAGAMENLGAGTFRETALLVDEAAASNTEIERVADVVAHEVAHM